MQRCILIEQGGTD